MNELFFYFIALSACGFAFGAVTSRNIFHCAVWLAMALLSVAGIYLMLDALFLGVIQVLVYIGGIITLFIFAIKLTARIDDRSIRQTNEQVLISAIAVSILLIFLMLGIKLSSWAVFAQDHIFSLKQIGKSLLTTYVLPFEFISLILLAAMVGAIVIGKVKK
ncbi:MAG TPA: NADH-quinone oxidoreductase subunit J [Candidatus Omnitrophota bacterium]|nr:NADH-quinone oxidoreductase subunit J [Candidatus Omnitrophota bacterium]